MLGRGSSTKQFPTSLAGTPLLLLLYPLTRVFGSVCFEPGDGFASGRLSKEEDLSFETPSLWARVGSSGSRLTESSCFFTWVVSFLALLLVCVEVRGQLSRVVPSPSTLCGSQGSDLSGWACMVSAFICCTISPAWIPYFYFPFSCLEGGRKISKVSPTPTLLLNPVPFEDRRKGRRRQLREITIISKIWTSSSSLVPRVSWEVS